MTEKISKRRRVPFIEQMQQTECGLCCMSMMAAYYNSSVSLYELREISGSGRDGTSLYQLEQLAKQLGFEANCYKLTSNDLKQVTLPAIIFWEDKHYVVLEKIKGNYYLIVDPALGRRRISGKDFQKSFSDYVLLCTPGPEFKKRKGEAVWKPFFQFLWKQPKMFVSVILFSLILQLFILGMPTLIQFMIDDVIMKQKQDMMNTFFIGILLLVVFHMVFTFVRGRCIITLNNVLDRQMMERFFSHILQLPYQFFQLRSFGDLLFRANSLRIIRDLFSNQLIKSVLDLGLVIVILTYMLIKSPVLSFWVIVFASLNIVMLIMTRPKLMEVNQEEILKNTVVQGTQTEILYGIFGVKTAGVEAQMYEKWSNSFEKLIQAYKKKEGVLNYINTATSTFMLLSPLMVLWIGAKQVFGNELLLGELMAFHAVSSQFFTLSNSLVQAGNSFILTTSYLKRVQDVLNAPVEPTPKHPIKLSKIKGNIELQKVSFAYSKYSSPVVKNINLKILQGQKIALVGKSGAGKSTLGRIILGLYHNISGRILYDGIDLREIDKSSLHSQIGVVPQDVTLFNRSVFENIAIHNSEVTIDEVIEAAKIARIHDEIMEMPMQYHTLISEMGMNLSGGQRQRIALARALVHKPSILFLDEATSSLDQINESAIDRYLSDMKCTRVVVAHRLSTVQNADQIIVLHNGEIVERGTYDQLINSKGYFAKFYGSFPEEENFIKS
ncbi:peptidase domain-containing ABC transporter [Paenactinomyces guangxiensis]|uniref:Peptidase domain-containing ABC transporter n=1 Tax=Paenactinomyces guangxiensis TaxID=1490290 RepID=A0A7W1WML5_9BACL|nr:peptidase domain-containing ABC transporter [Paenactinomyces guangxiensis]MBA4492717.1 peptidase domain-containing ABC transporter [Paenactinomyces guangxiensis]MBH8590435.1 peptidase domain-containing ABC transporter [Paenactinomyces guangxiensis]